MTEDDAQVQTLRSGITCNPLTGQTTERLVGVFNEAFSDYAVAVKMTPDRLDEMIRARSCDLTLSLGAFAGERFVGFLLIGRRILEGREHWYDVATGIVPDWRRRGLAGRLLNRALTAMTERKAAAFQLEVLEENSGAVALYRSRGFRISRRLRCWSLERAARMHADPETPAWDQRELGADFDETLWNGFTPSWQNRLDSWRNTPERHVVEIVRDRAGLMLGYAILHTASGNILQLGSRDVSGRESIVRELLDRLSERTAAPKLSLLNVEEDAWLNGQLAACGFENGINQYEMIREGAP